jgi:hypothetical protein
MYEIKLLIQALSIFAAIGVLSFVYLQLPEERRTTNRLLPVVSKSFTLIVLLWIVLTLEYLVSIALARIINRARDFGT